MSSVPCPMSHVPCPLSQCPSPGPVPRPRPYSHPSSLQSLVPFSHLRSLQSAPFVGSLAHKSVLKKASLPCPMSHVPMSHCLGPVPRPRTYSHPSSIQSLVPFSHLRSLQSLPFPSVTSVPFSQLRSLQSSSFPSVSPSRRLACTQECFEKSVNPA